MFYTTFLVFLTFFLKKCGVRASAADRHPVCLHPLRHTIEEAHSQVFLHVGHHKIQILAEI